jgi:hypothetical protein
MTQRRIVHGVDQSGGLGRRVDVWRNDAGGALVEGAQGEGRFVGAHPDDHWDPMDVGHGDVAPEIGNLVGPVLAVDHHEVEAADCQHLHQVLGGQPEQGTDQALSRAQT